MVKSQRYLFALTVFCFTVRLTLGQNAVTPDGIYRITPVRPIEQLRAEALRATPPKEEGKRAPDLVELVKLDSTIKLDIRYATSDNFLSTPVYTQARAFMQRPAAEALVRVNKKLRPRGYGLIIHDAYRPWYVTKMFWDATPPDKHIFVANPAEGSRHNRGCAVDLSLYDLKTGKEVEMPSVYDEMTKRAYPDYPGGTVEERQRRKILRDAMESEGFTVFSSEWWHFDYKSWAEYPILNTPFEKLGLGSIETDIPQANRVILTSGAWTPSVDETQKALIAIQSFLKWPTSGDQWTRGEIKKILENKKNYRVQFVGVVRDNRKVIWCNFFPTSRAGEKDEFVDWKHTVVTVCDGGYWFWQIDYDPGTGKCLNFSANGYA